MNWKLITVGLVTLSLLVFVGYAFKNDIKNVLYQGFQNKSVSSGKNEFNLYYAEWCPHCKPVLPEFDKLAPNGEVVVGGQTVKVSKLEVSAEKEKHKAANVTGYPTIKYSDADGNMTEYKGSRNSESFLEFLNEKLGGGI